MDPKSSAREDTKRLYLSILLGINTFDDSNSTSRGISNINKAQRSRGSRSESETGTSLPVIRKEIAGFSTVNAPLPNPLMEVVLRQGNHKCYFPGPCRIGHRGHLGPISCSDTHDVNGTISMRPIDRNSHNTTVHDPRSRATFASRFSYLAQRFLERVPERSPESAVEIQLNLQPEELCFWWYGFSWSPSTCSSEL